MSRLSGNNSSLHWADGLLFLVAIFWGVNFAAVKFGLAEIPPIIFNAARYFVAALIMLVYIFSRKERLNLQRKHLFYLIAIGILGNTGYPLFFIFGLDSTSADNATMIMATVPVWVALLGTFLGMERLEKQGWLGVGLSVAGILLVVLGGQHQADLRFGGASLRGDLIILAAVLCWAGYTLALRPLTAVYPPDLISALATAVGVIPMLLIALPPTVQFKWQTVSLAAWASLLLTAVFAVGLAYIFWGYGVAHLGSTRTALYLNVVPPIALLFNWLWLGETLTLLQGAGCLVALVGVSLARRHTATINQIE
ncbi:MAG: DMT family transporter [Chloroflexota bacterium]